LGDALWAYKSTFKSSIGLTKFQLVFGKACRLPVKFERKAFSALKFPDFDPNKASEKRSYNYNNRRNLNLFVMTIQNP
jgi:hypothetical protein